MTHKGGYETDASIALDMGVLLVDQPYGHDQIARWNSILDPLFAGRHDQRPRAYVSAEELDSAGILNEVLNDGIRSLIRALKADAVIYHCLASETPGLQRTPHVSAGDPGGWHRDSDAADGLFSSTTDYFSLMIYLSDVPSAGYGAFEGALGHRREKASQGMPTRQMLGEAGTTWLFDRSSLHRVHPNRSDVRRRLIKLSFQSNMLCNHHLTEGRFSETLTAVECRGDPFLRFLFGSEHPTSNADRTLPKVAVPPTGTSEPRPNASYEVTMADRVKARYHSASEQRWGAALLAKRSRSIEARVRRAIHR